MEEVVRRFEEYARRTADPAWGKRLRARRSRLAREKEQAVEKPQLETKKMRVLLEAEQSKAAIALSLKDYSKAFGDLVLFDKACLEIRCGEKVGLVGPNGSGKTSLLRDIVAVGNWEHLIIRVGPSLHIGYLSQIPETLNPENSIEDEIRLLGALSRNDAFSLLARFLFTWEDLPKKVHSLSGGEINPLQLARLMYLKPNFLVLDEPTNHLDIISREVLEDALSAFSGTVLVVSHDRYFLDKVVNRVVEVQEQKLYSYSGAFSDYWQQISGRRAVTNARLATRGTVMRQEKVRTKANQSQADHALHELEKRIIAEKSSKVALEQEITAAFSRGDHQTGRQLSGKLEKLAARIAKLYVEWEENG